MFITIIINTLADNHAYSSYPIVMCSCFMDNNIDWTIISLHKVYSIYHKIMIFQLAARIVSSVVVVQLCSLLVNSECQLQ